MILRVLFLLVALLLLTNLCLLTLCYITSENIYKKYGKLLLLIFGGFVFLVSATYVTLALLGLS